LPARSPPRIPRRVRPTLCFIHDADASTETCSACKLPFCNNCLVSLQGKPLCGPCKNFSIAGMGRTTRLLPLAVLALVVSLVSAPVVLSLTLLGVALHLSEGYLGVAVALCVLSLTVTTTGLLLGLLALRRFETQPQFAGRGLACGALCAAFMGMTWSVAVAAIVISRS
jgi:hypothetical protein